MQQYRRMLGIPTCAKILLSVGELNRNKNHEAVIRAVAGLKDPQIHYVIAGAGELREQLMSLARELGVEQQCHLLGYRTDVDKLYHMADLFIHPSLREGLPVSVMEAMASGLPCACSDIRGNRDLVKENLGGWLVRAKDVQSWGNVIDELRRDTEKSLKYGAFNRKIIEKFSLLFVEKRMRDLYGKFREEETKDD